MTTKTTTHTGYTVNITYASVDAHGFTIDNNKIRLNALSAGKNRTLIVSDSLIFALAEAPTKQGLSDYFTKRFGNSEKTISSVDIIETTFDDAIFKKIEEMEAFRLKAFKVQAEADAMAAEFSTLQQAFILLF
jgi:hypothetical protein